MQLNERGDGHALFFNWRRLESVSWSYHIKKNLTEIKTRPTLRPLTLTDFIWRDYRRDYMEDT